jgi:hypothetical protein
MKYSYCYDLPSMIVIFVLTFYGIMGGVWCVVWGSFITLIVQGVYFILCFFFNREFDFGVY